MTTLDCESAGRLLSLYLDGELSAEQRGDVEAHLARCESCRSALDAWSRIGLASMDLLRQAIPSSPVKLAEESPARKAPLRRPRASRAISDNRRMGPALLAAGALVALSLLVAYALLGSGSETSSPDRRVARPPKIEPAVDPQPPVAEPLPAPVPPSRPLPAPEVVSPAAPPQPPSPIPAPPTPAPPPAPPAPTPPQPKPAPAPEKPAPLRETATVVAELERLWGDVFVTTASGRAPVKEGHKLLSGSKLETAADSGRVILKYPDSSWIYAGAGTEFTLLNGGKRISLARGELTAEVAKQPKDQAFLFSTRNAEARVLGTRLALVAGDDATRLEVMQGRVRFTRAEDPATVEVLADHYAVAGSKGSSFAARRIPYGVSLLNDGGFEKNGQGWNTFNPSGDAVVRSPVRSGQKAQQVIAAGVENEVYQDVTVTPGTAYRATAWARCSNVGDQSSLRVFAQWLDAAGQLVRDADDLGQMKGTQDWTFVHGRFTAPAGAVRMRLYLHLGGSGTAWFDDVYFGAIK